MSKSANGLENFGFNTQPPVGRLETAAVFDRFNPVSTHSRLWGGCSISFISRPYTLFQHTAACGAAVSPCQKSKKISWFQHTAACGAADRFQRAVKRGKHVSTHSRLWGGCRHSGRSPRLLFSFNTQPPVGRLGEAENQTNRPCSFNTQPPVGRLSP